MTIQEIVQNIDPTNSDSINGTIQALKQRETEHPDVDKIKDQYEPSLHDITKKSVRPDKTITKEVTSADGKTTKQEFDRTEPVARITLALQKLIVKRAASFLFGNPVEVNSIDNELSPSQELILEAVRMILKDNKELSLNKRVAREMFKATEVAELWYPVDGKTSRYGFDSDTKLRVTYFSPFKGDELYPLFDETGDMIAFSRGYARKVLGKEMQFFETYTSDEKAVWKQGDGSNSWEEVERSINPIGKIPVVYGRQEEPEWADVQGLIDRLEKLLSNYADTIDYHASPTVFVKGDLKGMAKKGESGKILMGDVNSEAEYLSWDQAPDAVKLEIENDLRMIFSITQTPDISFESVKGIGNVTGIALKLMFLDAHLKVEDKKEIFIEYLNRRYNIIKSYIGVMSNKLKSEADNLELEPEITPYMLNDERTLIESISLAYGGSPFISRKTAIKMLAWVNDIGQEEKAINNETLGGLEE